MISFHSHDDYGGVDFYPENLDSGQTIFKNKGDAYHNMAIFYAQTDDSVLSVEVITIDKVTSDLSIFDDLDGQVEIIFALVS